LRVRTLEIVREASPGIQLEDAQVIVSAGAGAGSAKDGDTEEVCGDTWRALGCTRPVADEGWALWTP